MNIGVVIADDQRIWSQGRVTVLKRKIYINLRKPRHDRISSPGSE